MVDLLSAGALLFIDTEELGEIAKGEHDGCSEVAWDPTGRFLASIASAFYQKVHHDVNHCRHKFKPFFLQEDTGFYIWSSVGRPVQRELVRKLFHFTWRPRPASLLQAEHLEVITGSVALFICFQLLAQNVKKNRKTNQALFEQQDKSSQNKVRRPRCFFASR